MNELIQLSSRASRAPTTQHARVVLINPPPLRGRTNDRSLSGGIGVSRRRKPFEKITTEVPAIDVLYLAAVAERASAQVKLIDLLLEQLHGRRALRFCLDQIGPERGPSTWVGIRLSMPSLLADLAFANALKDALPDCKVFVFGSVIMATFDHWADQSRVDYVLYGEPEVFFERALAAQDPTQVEGVIDPRTYQPLRGDELYDEAKLRARYQHWQRAPVLESLPRPAWHLLELGRYARDGVSTAQVGVFIQASRGCPIGCTMCPYTLLEGDVWRKNDVARVVDEVEYLNRTYGVHRVRFRDANFGFSRKYARALAEALIARGVRLEASIESSIEVFDEETLALLRQAGINTITTGVETNDAACMESIGQKLQVNDKLRDRIATCHALGFHVYGTYCLGTPEETWDSVEKTWRFARELDMESGFTVMTPFPGTAMYFRALREGLLPKRMQFARWNSYRATVRTYALSTTDLDMARWWARMETILPYRQKRAKAQGPTALLHFYAAHVPHYVWRSTCRAYVALRRRMAEPARAPALHPSESR